MLAISPLFATANGHWRLASKAYRRLSHLVIWSTSGPPVTAATVGRLRVIMPTVGILVLSWGLTGSTTHIAAQEMCARIPPQQGLAGVRWYADNAGSIVDREKRRQHEAAVKPLHDLMQIVSAAADQALERASKDRSASCALTNLSAWAKNGALLARPRWGVDLGEQTIAVVGLNLAALKLNTGGQPLPLEVLAWIGKTTEAIVATYEAGVQRANLYAWSGVAAASNDVLSGTGRFKAYHDRVWRESVAKIRADGYVDGELSRRGRAHIYHNYLRGALTLLKRLRARLGLAATPEELAALGRLDAVVNANACDSAPIAALAGAPQEPFSRWETSIGTYFAEAGKDPSWQRCTRTPASFSGPTYGGRFDMTSRTIDGVPAR